MTGTKKTTTNGNKCPGFILQPRDTNALREIGIMRVAEAAHVKIAAGFGSTTRVNARLLKLTRAGLLRRFFLGSGGGRKALYALSEKGAHLTLAPCRGPRRRQGQTLVADFFVQHQLSINDLYCNVKFGTIPVPQISFKCWESFQAPLAQNLSLIPDGYVEFSTRTGIDACFIEVDLGHEALSIWREKAVKYIQLAMSGEYERRFQQPRFRVLVVVNSERRLRSIRAAIATATQKIFWFATLDAIRGEQFFGAVWLRPTGDEYQPFFTQTL